MPERVFDMMRRFLACTVAAAWLAGCSEKPPEAEVTLLFNEVNLPWAVSILNKGRTEFAVEGFVMNGEFEVKEYVRGFFQSAGKLPVTLKEGDTIILMTAPFSWKKTPTRVSIQINGSQWEYQFE